MARREWNRLDKPRSIEDLSQQERVKRLHHQLSVIYDRVFLAGDWSADYRHPKETQSIRENVFEDMPATDPRILTEDLGRFVTDANKTVTDKMTPQALETRTGMRELNRRLFLEVIRLVQTILVQSAKDIGTREELEMQKCIDENIHLFRDLPLSVKGAFPDVADDEDKATEGLQKMLRELQTIAGTFEKPLRQTE